MQSKTSWWLLGITVVATATATLATLEYAHRCPESRLAQILRRAHLVTDHASTSAPRVKIEAASPTHSATQPSPVSLPPDILEHTLRDLRLLDQLSQQHLHEHKTPETSASFSLDEFSPEKIPVPPRAVQAQDNSVPTTPTSHDRHLAPVVTVEVLPVAPQPQQSDPVPGDLDDETSQLEQSPAQDDYQADERLPAPDNAPPAPSTGDQVRGRALARCNSCGSVSDLVECLREWLAWCSAYAGHADTSATAPDCTVERGAICVQLQMCRRGVAAQCSGSGEKASNVHCRAQSAPSQRSDAPLVRCVYPVGDLIESQEDGDTLRNLVADFVYPGAWQHQEQAGLTSAFVAQACGAPSSKDRDVCCVQETARGKIEYFAGTRCLIVLHTAEVQKQVAQFLKELRRAAQCQQAGMPRAALGSIPCPPQEPEHVLVVPVVRPVLVPVAVPVPVGSPELELPPPRFRIPQHAPADDDDFDPPAGRFVPPATPEKLPDCDRIPVRLPETLRRFWQQGRGAMPQLPSLPNLTPKSPIHPHAPRVLPSSPNRHCPEDFKQQPADEDEYPDLEDFQPLEIDLNPRVG